MKVLPIAQEIVEHFREHGFTAYFAGGWVRDYLMGHPSADIDIATNAPPEEIVRLFEKTIPVGISFGVVVVVLKGHHFEVSTFRSDIDYADGRRPSRIELTTEQEDALRRDFTINGMFFDPVEKRVIDYVGGREDIKKQVVRTIGDPQERFREDRLRMIRAVRFACRFGYRIDEDTRIAIKENARFLLPAVAIERVWQELKKMTEYPGFDQAVCDLHRLGLLQVVFPELQGVKQEELQRRVSSCRNFPEECPEILFLMELFPDASLEAQIDICWYLKVSNKDQKIVEFMSRVRSCIEESCEDVEWARLFANPFCELALEVAAARLEPGERDAFLEGRWEKREQLSEHIERIKEKKPLVASQDLRNEGVPPGIAMGRLLDEAERIAINQDLHCKEDLIARLKKSVHWPL